MTTMQQAVEALIARSANSPFVVHPTSRGAQVRWNIADQQWLSMMDLNDASRVASADVRVDESSQKFSRAVTMHAVDWSAGAHGLRYGNAVQSGSVRQIEVHRELGVRTDGEPGPVGWSFDTKTLTDFVDDTLEPMGLAKELDRNSRIGLYVGIGALIFAAIVGALVVLLVVRK